MGVSAAAGNAEEDSAKIEELQRLGWAVGELHEIGHFFSLREPPGQEPRAAVQELRALGLWTALDEEVSGDGYWHIGAFANQKLSSDGVASWRRTMESLAERHQLVYEGWNKPLASHGPRRVSTLVLAKACLIPLGLVAGGAIILAMLLTR
jgi:hypothetical protein